MKCGTQRQGLRTKTGCLTCRNRRKKCDEEFPVCKLCHASKRECIWPTPADLLDRRYTSHHRSRHSRSPTSHKVKLPTPCDDISEVPTLCLFSASTAHKEITRNLEIAISRHFVEKYYCLLLLPNCHPNFYHGWINEIQHLMTVHKSLHYSVLANAASHIHFIDTSSRMQELALTYYSQALRGLSAILTRPSQLESHNGLLMSVMFLYLHGCMGRGTYSDIPRHVNAATRILTLRLFDRPLAKNRPFDRLAVESVLYQIFLVTTGLWSDQMSLDYDFDTQFWLQAERLLYQSTLFPTGSNILNSPVLGVPVPLFRLTITLKRLYQGTSQSDLVALHRIRTEVEEWEMVVLSGKDIDCLSPTEPRNRKHEFYTSASYLYILIISLLFDQISQQVSSAGPPSPALRDCWQIEKVIQVLQRYRDDDEWKWCFLGNWPIYTLGFFMSDPDHIEIVRSDVWRRWELTKFSQLYRFSNDLEETWAARGFQANMLESVTEIL